MGCFGGKGRVHLWEEGREPEVVLEDREQNVQSSTHTEASDEGIEPTAFLLCATVLTTALLIVI